MLNFIWISIIFLSSGINPSALRGHYHIVDKFINETCLEYCINSGSVMKVLADEYALQLWHMKKINKKTKIKTLTSTMSWCRYWRDHCQRLEFNPKNIAKLSKGEIFFRSLQKRE